MCLFVSSMIGQAVFVLFCFLVVVVVFVLCCTHNLCFGANITKIGKPLHTPVLLYKCGFKGVYFSWTCFPDVRQKMTE